MRWLGVDQGLTVTQALTKTPWGQSCWDHAALADEETEAQRGFCLPEVHQQWWYRDSSPGRGTAEPVFELPRSVAIAHAETPSHDPPRHECVCAHRALVARCSKHEVSLHPASPSQRLLPHPGLAGSEAQEHCLPGTDSLRMPTPPLGRRSCVRSCPCCDHASFMAPWR